MERHHTQVKGRGQSENRKAAKATAGNYGFSAMESPILGQGRVYWRATNVVQT